MDAILPCNRHGSASRLLLALSALLLCKPILPSMPSHTWNHVSYFEAQENISYCQDLYVQAVHGKAVKTETTPLGMPLSLVQCIASLSMILVQVWRGPLTGDEFLFIVGGHDLGRLETRPWCLNLTLGVWTSAPLPGQHHLPNSVYEIPPRHSAASFKVSRDWLLIHGGWPYTVRSSALLMTCISPGAW